MVESRGGGDTAYVNFGLNVAGSEEGATGQEGHTVEVRVNSGEA